jgi:hypothetical protein
MIARTALLTILLALAPLAGCVRSNASQNEYRDLVLPTAEGPTGWTGPTSTTVLNASKTPPVIVQGRPEPRTVLDVESLPHALWGKGLYLIRPNRTVAATSVGARNEMNPPANDIEATFQPTDTRIAGTWALLDANRTILARIGVTSNVTGWHYADCYRCETPFGGG